MNGFSKPQPADGDRRINHLQPANKGQRNPDSQTNPFSCNICHRSYTRLDHLSRHYRSHTREKPFTCEVCKKSFARADLLKRHIQNHETTDENGRKRQKVTQPTPARAAQACKSCAASKVRCEGEDPCKRCEQKAIPCRYSHRDPNTNDYSTSEESLISPPNSSQQTSNPDLSGTPQQMVNVPVVSAMGSYDPNYAPAMPNYVPEGPMYGPNNVMPMPNGMGMNPGNMDFSQFPGTMGEISGFDQYDTGLSNFLRDVMTPFQTGEDPMNRSYAPQPYYPAFDLLDFATTDPFNMPVTEFTGQPSPISPPIPTVARPDEATVPATKSGYTTPSRAGISLGIKAFNESLWHYAPRQGNQMGEDQIDMFVPLEELVHKTRLPTDKRPCPSLKHPTRDRILTTVIAQCDPTLSPSVTSSFPSAELLTNLIHHFLIRHAESEDTWIHIPSFNPNQQSSEFLMSMIAAGAMYSEMPEIRKLGFAFQEAARIAALKVFENDNRTTRFLKPIQSFTLTLDCGLWSGDRRKLELAECFALTVITMIRRGGFLRTPPHTAFVPSVSDTPEDIEVKWQSWIEQESFKRLAFHLCIRDTQMSSSLVIPPLISTSEMSTELPASLDLWHAKTSAEWKQLYVDRYMNLPGRIPTLRGLCEDLTVMQNYLHVVDTNLTILLLLSGLWSLTCNYRELTRLDAHHLPRNAVLISESLYRETIAALEHCKFTCLDWTENMSPIATLFHERVLLSMQVSLEEVQLLAGKAGEEEARRVYPLLCEWAESSESRQALWHAGQIFRAAKNLPPHNLQDFAAVALYHASLVFWAYSVVAGHAPLQPKPEPQASQSHHQSPGSDVSTHTSVVHLDGEKSECVRRFAITGRGIPVIILQTQLHDDHDGEAHQIPVSDARALMCGMVDLLKRNNGSKDEECTPLITNLSKLMRALGGAAGWIKAAQAKQQKIDAEVPVKNGGRA